MAEELPAAVQQRLVERLQLLPVEARRLLCVIVRQAHHGALRSKAAGRATMPEIHEACGLDVDELQRLLNLLRDIDFISLDGSYPFEEVQLEGAPAGESSIWEIVLNRCNSTGMPLEMVVVTMQLEQLR